MADAYEADPLVSETKNFTVTPPAGKQVAKETVMVSYYVKKLTEKTTGKSVYQLHGNCYVNDMNVAGFSKTVVNKNAC
jgi:hypothetical protein